MQQIAQGSFPEMYERELVGPLFQPWAEDIVGLTRVGPGDRVLDVACGTGIVARLAGERAGDAGHVVGVDVNAGMLAVARRLAPHISWRDGDATALPVGAAERFDIVTCQQGLQFFADRALAMGEMRRVLGPGGRLAVSTWRSDEEMPVLHELRRIAERSVGPIPDRRHSFAEAGELEALLVDAGFEQVRVEAVTKTIRFRDGAVFVRLNAMALVGMSAGKHLSDEERARIVGDIVSDSRSLIDAHSRSGFFCYEIGANVATATA